MRKTRCLPHSYYGNSQAVDSGKVLRDDKDLGMMLLGSVTHKSACVNSLEQSRLMAVGAARLVAALELAPSPSLLLCKHFCQGDQNCLSC